LLSRTHNFHHDVYIYIYIGKKGSSEVRRRVGSQSGGVPTPTSSDTGNKKFGAVVRGGRNRKAADTPHVPRPTGFLLSTQGQAHGGTRRGEMPQSRRHRVRVQRERQIYALEAVGWLLGARPGVKLESSREGSQHHLATLQFRSCPSVVSYICAHDRRAGPLHPLAVCILLVAFRCYNL